MIRSSVMRGVNVLQVRDVFRVPTLSSFGVPRDCVSIYSEDVAVLARLRELSAATKPHLGCTYLPCRISSCKLSC